MCVLWSSLSSEFVLNTSGFQDFPAIISINLDKLNQTNYYNYEVNEDDNNNHDDQYNEFEYLRNKLNNTFKERNLLYDDPLTFELTLAIQNSHCEVRKYIPVYNN